MEFRFKRMRLLKLMVRRVKYSNIQTGELVYVIIPVDNGRTIQWKGIVIAKFLAAGKTQPTLTVDFLQFNDLVVDIAPEDPEKIIPVGVEEC